MQASALYSPYGAFEQKAEYQKNYSLGTLITLSFVLLILGVAWAVSALPEEDYDDVPAVVIRTVADLGPPPSVAKKPPQVKVSAPQVAAPKVGIPKPVADDEVIDEDVVIATRDELADIVAPDVTEIADGGEIAVEIDPEDYLPSPDEFIPVEIYPEMIHEENPDYPRLAKQAGITGTVWIKALVDEQGDVLKAIVAKSSGTVSLDESAIDAAYKNKFKPGIQNGRPVKVWVTYPVEYTLEGP
ncbi:MAG: energy transducer TonB [Candidatus Zixiibacteriota bacterium]|nr:MAG: energy transducer TonB [candidate division Zixibacteria bacterium]